MKQIKNLRRKPPKGPFYRIRQLDYTCDAPEGAVYSFEKRTRIVELIKNRKDTFVFIRDVSCTPEANSRPVTHGTASYYRVAVADTDSITADNWEEQVIRPCVYSKDYHAEGVLSVNALMVSRERVGWKTWLMVLTGGFLAMTGFCCLPVVIFADEMTFPQKTVIIAYFLAMLMGGCALFRKGIKRLNAIEKAAKVAAQSLIPEASKPVELPETPEVPKPVELPETPEVSKPVEQPEAPEVSKPVEQAEAPEASTSAGQPGVRIKLSAPIGFDGSDIHIDSKPILVALSHDKLDKIHEFTAVLPLTEKEPVIRLYEDGIMTREYRLQTEGNEDFAGKYFHISVRLSAPGNPPTPAVQIDGFISDTPEERKMTIQDIGYRMEACFLRCGGIFAKLRYEHLRGQDLVAKGLKYPGYTTPAYVRLIGICPECGKSFTFRGYAFYMMQQDVAYSDDGLDCMAIQEPISDRENWMCRQDGKIFRYYNPFCCPHCGDAYIDYRTFRRNKAFGVSGCVHLGRKPFQSTSQP